MLMFSGGLRQRGHALIVDPVGGDEELDSITCAHCDRVIWVKPFKHAEAMGGVCTCCGKYYCPGCIGRGCTPLEKRLDASERLSRLTVRRPDGTILYTQVFEKRYGIPKLNFDAPVWGALELVVDGEIVARLPAHKAPHRGI